MVKRCLLVLALASAHAPLAAGAAGAGAATLAAPAAGPHAAAEKFRDWKIAAAQILAARADANSLVTAAALRYAGSAGGPAGGSGKTAGANPKQSAVDLAARAGELQPQNASIGWLHLQLCSGTQNCDIRDVATVMRWVDADNAAAWLQTLAAAERDRDQTEVDRIIADMAHGARFDLYWNRLVVLMVDALSAARSEIPGGFAGSDAARLTVITGIAGGEVIPAFAPLVEACRESGTVPERRELCLRLSKIMQRGDTIVTQLTGFSIERRLLPPDSKEARAITERKHVLEWRQTEAAKFDTPLLPWMKNPRARARLARMRSMPREEDVCIAILREHKMALEPAEEHR
jgi:hypothetical protein